MIVLVFIKMKENFYILPKSIIEGNNNNEIHDISNILGKQIYYEWKRN